MSTPAGSDVPTVDAVINVAQLLKQQVGATRRYHIKIDRIPLDEEHVAHGIHGDLRLTRVGSSLLVQGNATAQVELACVRCLEEYTTEVHFTIEDEFRPSVDVTSGVAVNYTEDEAEQEGYFLLSDNHELDLTESLRQSIWLAVPMMPVCRTDCPGIAFDQDAEAPASEALAPVDERLTVLERLLDTSDNRQHDDGTGPQASRPMQ